MTELEMTKLCAEALEIVHWSDTPIDREGNYWVVISGTPLIYDPLHDDAQAMALVKTFELALLPDRNPEGWSASYQWESPGCINTDLNRAIVECIAKMQIKTHAAKEK